MTITIITTTTEQTIIKMMIHVAIGDSEGDSSQFVCLEKITSREYKSSSLFNVVHLGVFK